METIVSRDFEAYLDELTLITILLPRNRSWEANPTFQLLKDDGKSYTLEVIFQEEHDHFFKYQCTLMERIRVENNYQLICQDAQTDLQIGAVVRTEQFDAEYAYDGDDLGVQYSSPCSTFKIWAPTATQVLLQVIDATSGSEETLEMLRMEKGVWEKKVEKDVEGFYYIYKVCVNQIWRVAVDPYAKSVSLNGEFGVIIDPSKIKKTFNASPSLIEFTDAIIYETHIRDFTIHPGSGVDKKGTYKGFTESTTDTGLDYVSRLGITHIELLPVNDFGGINEAEKESSYNWGYNPLHFFAPEGSYSLNPSHPYERIYELQEMIDEIHKKGISVILDVVFNHVYVKEDSSFEKVVPGYYFRYDQHGFPSNGTGVGNDIASERRMVRKFIVDCILYWTHTFQVDGFRFDLMGILDIDTMNEIKRTINKLDRKMLLLGEGWELNTPLPVQQKATIRNSSKMDGIAFFNDRFRDSVKGSTFNLYDRGFCLGNTQQTEEVKKVVAGSLSVFDNPELSVNYVESHDNHTFWDKAVKCNSMEEKDIIRKRQKLATCMVLLSQGIPFLHSGQEFYRTKQGEGNSYKSSDEINQLDWELCKKWAKDVTYIQQIISIRKSHRSFRFNKKEQVNKHMRFLPTNPEVIAYELVDVGAFGEWDQIVVIFNNSLVEQQIVLPQKDSWMILADHLHASESGLYTLVTKKLIVQPVSCLILAKQMKHKFT
ncbi:type I pullulanase [Bacillus pinisoli]|uniref:type I pullulanase n=1 Tax=Bacillus pinisoli TaxID=2901866 RepID=UPI001FF69151|nr:type I pullulanase [Bacillus pinisoli]